MLRIAPLHHCVLAQLSTFHNWCSLQGFQICLCVFFWSHKPFSIQANVLICSITIRSNTLDLDLTSSEQRSSCLNLNKWADRNHRPLWGLPATGTCWKHHSVAAYPLVASCKSGLTNGNKSTPFLNADTCHIKTVSDYSTISIFELIPIFVALSVPIQCIL